MQMNLTRIGHALGAQAVRDGWNCQFDNHTGHPEANNTATIHRRGVLKTGHRVSFIAAQQSSKGGKRQCIKLNQVPDVQLSYKAVKLPCWPCDVSFSISTPAVAMKGRYLSIGFKGMNAAYAEKH